MRVTRGSRRIGKGFVPRFSPLHASRRGRPQGGRFAGWFITAGAALAGGSGCASQLSGTKNLEYIPPQKLNLSQGLTPLEAIQPLDADLLERAFLSPAMLHQWSDQNDPSLLRVPVSRGILDVIYGGTSIEEQIARGVKNPAILFYESGTPDQIWGSSDYLSTLGREILIIGYSPLGHGWSTDVDPITGQIFDYSMGMYTRTAAELLLKMRVDELLERYPQAQLFFGGHSYGPSRLTHLALEAMEPDPLTGQPYLHLAGRRMAVGGFVSVAGYHPQINGVKQEVSRIDEISSDPLFGRFVWKFAKMDPEGTVGKAVDEMSIGGKGGYPGGPMEEVLKPWYDDTIGYTEREALGVTQAGIQMAKQAPSYYEASRARFPRIAGLPFFLLAGSDESVIIAQGDRPAKKGTTYPNGFRFGNPRTQETYYGRLLAGLRQVTGTGDLTQLKVIPGAGHFCHEGENALRAATLTRRWMESLPNPQTRAGIMGP